MENTNRKNKLHYGGFTLIEMVVVVIIIGILASIALPVYNNVVERSRASEAFTNLKGILDSQMRNALETDVYATSTTLLDINVTNSHYYTYATPLSAVFSDGISNTSAIASAARNGGNYTIQISEAGTFVCSGCSAGLKMPQ